MLLRTLLIKDSVAETHLPLKQRHELATTLQRFEATKIKDPVPMKNRRTMLPNLHCLNGTDAAKKVRTAIKAISLSLVLSLATFLPLYSAVGENETSFFPVWKLLQQREKKVFLSGYQKGIQDSRKVMSILREHIQQNPQSALESLDKINELYQTAELPIEDILQGVAIFYSNPENHDAPLSVAFSASKAR